MVSKTINKMKIRLHCIGFVLLFFLCSNGSAQIVKKFGEKDSIVFKGSIDVYFRGNINGTNDDENGTVAPVTAFANLPGFALGMFNLVSTYEKNNVGAVSDLVFGPRGVDAVFKSQGSKNLVNQLYVFWNLSDAIKLTLGNFNTFLGYEVISPVDNFNYSTSYLFSYGPFSHTGIKADFDFKNGFTGMVGLFNPNDATDFNLTKDYVGGFQLGYSTDKANAYINSTISEDFVQLDVTAGMNFTDFFMAALT